MIWIILNRDVTAAAAAKSLQSCPTLCDLIDGSPPGFAVPGILQARTLECVAISFSNAWKGKVKVKSLSRVRLLATSWTAVYQAPPSMGCSRQEYWSGVPLPSPILRHWMSWKQTFHIFCLLLWLFHREGKPNPCFPSWMENKFSLIHMNVFRYSFFSLNQEYFQVFCQNLISVRHCLFQYIIIFRSPSSLKLSV